MSEHAAIAICCRLQWRQHHVISVYSVRSSGHCFSLTSYSSLSCIDSSTMSFLERVVRCTLSLSQFCLSVRPSVCLSHCHTKRFSVCYTAHDWL